jgi:hypothetical protein
MATLLYYNIITILLIAYFGYQLFIKEKQFFIISIYFIKSKFHLCLLLNTIVMVLVNVGYFTIRIFFGEIILRDLMVIYYNIYNVKEIMEKIRLKFVTFLLLFLTFRPIIDFFKILLILFFFCFSFVNWLTIKRSNFFISTTNASIFQHFKLIYLYLVLSAINYFMYTYIYSIVEATLSKIDNKSFFADQDSIDYLIYYLLSLEVKI